MKKGTKVAVGTALAAGMGYAAGILSAPKSGKETRKDIQKKAMEAKKESERKLKQLNSELTDLIMKGKSTAKNAKDSTKAELHKALEAAVTAKEKGREILSALHEGETDDKDLKKAVSEVHKAVDHLKKYLKKHG